MSNSHDTGFTVEQEEKNGITTVRSDVQEAGGPPGGSEGKTAPADIHNIPYNNMKVVFPGILLAVFMAALDQTITAVALPTIVNDIGGETGYSWVGTAYLLRKYLIELSRRFLLGSGVAPVYGKISDLFGRKPVYYFALFVFLLGSALCGAAQTFVWLAICRGLQGIGGGGLIQLSQITVSDITPLHQRGNYLGMIGAIWGMASVVGPLVGGALTDASSWRWCFWINLPTGGIAAFIIFAFLKLNPTQKKTVREMAAAFDFLGLFLILGGIACLLVGFNSGQTAWKTAETIALLTVGGLLTMVALIHENFTKRNPIIPPRLFTMRTTAGILVSTFLHGIAFFAGNYYLPVYFQVLGASAIMAGIKTMAYSFVSAMLASIAGLLVARTGKYRMILWCSWAVMTLGYGLMIRLNEKTSIALQEIYILIAALGVGPLFQVPLLVLQAAMPVKDMAMSTATFNLLRTIGGTIGISIGDAIYATDLQRRLRSISGYHPSERKASSITSSSNVLQPIQLRNEVFAAYTRSLSLIWVVMTPIVFVGFLFIIPVRTYSLKRPSRPTEPQPKDTPGVSGTLSLAPPPSDI
ncbi:MFS general substrate transporter [Neolentinus lepideus HHB14362 ss-1]|uniref:MFS general substrate transporter n=1 Tax=Neolentinus lepideus HHB14362 ss-1 TaxID=1314782 RepID=A0A165SYI5_9AGAM|nr:MFS general substrate transporter [Neolentinus lepideus HHB14362 ss-1]